MSSKKRMMKTTASLEQFAAAIAALKKLRNIEQGSQNEEVGCRLFGDPLIHHSEFLNLNISHYRGLV